MLGGVNMREAPIWIKNIDKYEKLAGGRGRCLLIGGGGLYPLGGVYKYHWCTLHCTVTLVCSAVVVFLFLAGLSVYRSHYKRPPFLPKVNFGGPNYRLQRLMLRLMLTGPAGLCWQLDRPDRTPSICVAWQLQHWVKKTLNLLCKGLTWTSIAVGSAARRYCKTINTNKYLSKSGRRY